MPIKVSVTYRAPKDDSKVCEMYGHTFFDSRPVEIEDTPENGFAIGKLSRNKVFEVIKGAVARHRAKVEPDPDPVPEPEPIEEPEPEIEKPVKHAAPVRHKTPKRNAPWLKRAKR